MSKLCMMFSFRLKSLIYNCIFFWEIQGPNLFNFQVLISECLPSCCLFVFLLSVCFSVVCLSVFLLCVCLCLWFVTHVLCCHVPAFCFCLSCLPGNALIFVLSLCHVVMFALSGCPVCHVCLVLMSYCLVTLSCLHCLA